MTNMQSLADICEREPVVAYESMSVADAARLMLEQHVGSLVVVDETEGGRIVVGMLTDRDIVLAVVARDFNAQTIRVAEIMSKVLTTCRSDDSMTNAMELMRRDGVRRIPVTTAQGVLVGIVAFDDILESIAKDLRNLTQVIASEHGREARVRG